MKEKTEKPVPPDAEAREHVRQVHDTVLRDPYFWMRDREDSGVVRYLEAENAYTRAILKPTEALQDRLYQEMLGRIKETDLSVPVRRDDYFYYSRTEKGKQYSIFCRKYKSLDAQEEIILDLNELGEGFEYFSVGVLRISPSHRYLAYSTDTEGSEVYTLYIKDLQTNRLLTETITGTATSAEWAEDDQTLFYSILDEMKRPYKLMRHRLATDPAQDKEVFHEKDDSFFLGLDKTRDRKFLVLDLSSKTTSEEHCLEAANPDGGFRVIHPRQTGMEYSVDHHDNRFFILTNEDAVNFKIMEAPDAAPGKKNWKEVIAHRRDVKIEDVDLFKDFMVVYVREGGFTSVYIREFATGQEHRIEFPEPVYTVWGGTNPQFETDILRIGYSSLITPSSVIDYHMRTREREVKKQQEVLGGYDSSAYQSERIYAEAPDGARIPVSLVYRKGMKRDGRNVMLLYGYGSYGMSMDPFFSSNRLSLLDRGVVFAIAHIRGGGEMGRPWYDDGKLMKKINSFTDFIASAEHLTGEKYTSPDKLVIAGGSAGGLLMGSVVNMRPDLFHGCLMHVPFVDVVNTMLDPSLPLTVTEYDEWGNPQEKEVFEYIRSYSPYDNIRAQKYPHMLVTGGLNDPRVQYWEPAKWTAKLRRMKEGDSLLLLKMHMGAGHGGPSGRYDYLKDVAFDYAFILLISGIDTEAPS